MEALKKSQKGQLQTPLQESPPSSPLKLSIARIASLSGAAAIALYLGVVFLSGKVVSPATPISTIATVTVPLPELGGIVWDPETPLALLGGRPLKIGQAADGWTVQSITTDQVRLSRDGITQVLSLPETHPSNPSN